LLAATVAALAIGSAPAYAGGDDCDGGDEARAGSVAHMAGGGDCPPAAPARPAPVPAQPTPAQPVPVPVKPAPVPARPAPVVRKPAKPQPRQTTRRQPVQRQVSPVQTRQVVPQQRTFVQGVQTAQTVPSGGVQTGAGGTALPGSPPSPTALATPALLLMLLLLVGGLRAAHARSRR
jgi:hypothetical protein